ncbi:MAG: hypothetical protein ABIG08_00020 [bacterium]
MKGVKKIIAFLFKALYVMLYILGILTIYPLFNLQKKLGRIEEVYLEKGLAWNKGKRQYVSNHPTWLDQFFTIGLRLGFFGTNYVPFIVIAEDSIKRIPWLDWLKKTYFLIPIERRGSFGILKEHIKNLEFLLTNGYNLMMAGASGRDFKVDDDQKVFSPIKGKPLRKFTNLCGYLSILPGVETIPFYIEGTEKFYREIIVNGEREAEFSSYNFVVRFLILGNIKVKVIYGVKLVLEGKSPREATKVIQEKVLSLLDY